MFLPVRSRPVPGTGALFVILLAALCLSGGALADERLVGRVDRVADGDTFTLTANGTRRRIRLYEIDAPERGQPGGRASRDALASLVAGKYVRLEIETVDDYGRSVAKVWLGNRDINREMVREGHAWAYRRYLKDQSLLADEAAARAAKRGLWRQADPMPPWQWRHGGRPAATHGHGNTSPERCNIKGNINRRGEHIYHLPGDPSYAETRIDPARGERWFCSPEEAERSGWRPPR